MFLKNILIISVFIGLISCKKEGTTELGKVAVPNSNGIELRIFYKWEMFERKYPHFYQILRDGEDLTEPIFIFGILDEPYEFEDLNFSLRYKNDIIYLFSTYPDDGVAAIYDLKSKTGYPHENSGSEHWSEKNKRKEKYLKLLKD